MIKENYIPFGSYFRPQQHSVVAIGAVNFKVFTASIPESCIGFVNRLASTYYDNITITFKVDGEVFDIYERQMGLMQQPNILDPPINFKNKIEVFVTNNSGASVDMDVLVNGFLQFNPIQSE